MNKHFLFLFFLANFFLLPTANLFSQGPWTQKANMPGLSRHRVFAFSIGSRGYIGCGWNGTTMYGDVFEYDPGSNSWTQKADYPPGPRLSAFGFSIGNKGYVGAGLDQNLVSMSDFYQFDPVANTWTQKNYFSGSPRFGCGVAVLNNKAYIAMGDEWDPNYYRQNDLWVYDPTFDSWNYLSQWPPDGRRDPCGFTLGTKIYFGTGADNGGWENNDFWSYDPSNGIWTQKANCGSIPRAQACCFAVNGKGYIGMGQIPPNGDDVQDFLQYDPTLNTWKNIDAFPGAGRENCFSFVIGNKAFITCGTNGINYNDLWEFDPNKITDVQDVSENISVNIFPNPMHESTTLTISQPLTPNSGITFALYDLNGKLIRTSTISHPTSTISRSNLSAGTYVYHLMEGPKQLSTGKLIVQ